MKPTVIGISGKMGAGKTTLTKALGLNLGATIIGWDEFDEISKSPLDLIDWYKRGQNYSEWDYSALAEVLKSLKSNQVTFHPVFKKNMQPTQYIIFDSPLGRLHQQTGQYIDICIHISVPLDVLLCRYILRDFKSATQSKEELLAELNFYLSYSRPLFMDDNLKAKADLVLDGVQTIEDQVKQVKAFLGIK